MEKAVKYSIRASRSKFDSVNVRLSNDAYNFTKKLYTKNELQCKEIMYALFLTQANDIKGFYKVSEGTMTNTLFDVKAICNVAINSMSCSVILVHNHPSGRLTPSEQDKNGTTRIKEALSMLDIRLIDHIILSGTSESFLSFANCGLI